MSIRKVRADETAVGSESSTVWREPPGLNASNPLADSSAAAASQTMLDADPVWDPAAARGWERSYSRRLWAADIIVVTLAVLCASLVNSSVLNFGSTQGLVSSVVLVVLWTALLGIWGARDPRAAMTGSAQIRRVWSATSSLFGAVAAVGLVAGWEEARTHLLVTLPVALLLLVGTRRMWRARLRRHSCRSGAGTRRVLVMGDRGKAEHIAAHLRRQGPESGYSVAGLIALADDEEQTEASQDIVSRATDAATRVGVDAVILAAPDALDPVSLRELGWRLAELDISLSLAPSLEEVAGSRLRTESVGGLPVVHVEYPKLRGSAALIKRGFDIVFSLTALIMIAPILAVLALAVVIDSRGPVLFKQERIGLNHSRFTMFKIRSMVVDAEQRRQMLLADSEGNEVLFKMRRDPRITRIGGVMRRLGLDELPQFLNVLRGEMSVVGPRPPLPGEVEGYDDLADRRLLVKPGITGLWQVHGRSDLSWEDSLRLDLYYVENWSLTTDISIVLRTVPAVVTGNGAY